jgi:hypothetical protein
VMLPGIGSRSGVVQPARARPNTASSTNGPQGRNARFDTTITKTSFGPAPDEALVTQYPAPQKRTSWSPQHFTLAQKCIHPIPTEGIIQ